MKRLRSVLSGYLGTIQGVVAVALICAGVAMFSIPGALIVAGVLILADRLT